MTRYWLQGMRAKLGLVTEDEADLDLATGLLSAMEGQQRGLHVGVPATSPMRPVGENTRIRALFADASAYDHWCDRWQARLAREAVAPAVRAQAMRRVESGLHCAEPSGRGGLERCGGPQRLRAVRDALAHRLAAVRRRSRRLPPLRNLRRQAKGAIAPSAAPE